MTNIDKELQELRNEIRDALTNDVLNARQILAATWVLGRINNKAFGIALNVLMTKGDTGLTPNDLHAYTCMLDLTEDNSEIGPAFFLPLMCKVGIVYDFYEDNGSVKPSALAIISPVDDGFAIPYEVNGIGSAMKEYGDEIT